MLGGWVGVMEGREEEEGEEEEAVEQGGKLSSWRSKSAEKLPLNGIK